MVIKEGIAVDIYKYIRSKDVRVYNEKIGHKFTALELAFFVWSNSNLTLKEKHAAWLEIMSEMPDEKVSKRVNTMHAPSLFSLLEEFIKTDNALIEEFYKKDEQTVYSCGYYSKNESFYDDFG